MIDELMEIYTEKKHTKGQKRKAQEIKEEMNGLIF